jgi:MFS superfamily sulfate permease-like transporter
MVALGTANVASGLFGGFTTDASLSQTATAESAGARTQLASLVTSALILATAVFLAPLFADLPNAVLGAIVIAAVLGLMDVAEMRRYWAWRRTDFLIAMTAMIGVVLTSVLAGMALAVLLSVAFVLYRASRPYIAALGRMPGVKSAYGDLSRHPDATPVDGLVILRIDAPLYFFNANVAQAQISDLVTGRVPRPRAVLLDLGATADLDVTTGDMLAALVGDLQEHGVTVMLAQVKGRVRDRLRRTGLMERIGERNVHLSIPAGVAAFHAVESASGGAPGGSSTPTPALEVPDGSAPVEPPAPPA